MTVQEVFEWTFENEALFCLELQWITVVFFMKDFGGNFSQGRQSNLLELLLSFVNFCLNFFDFFS
jgi:hypothetical protein